MTYQLSFNFSEPDPPTAFKYLHNGDSYSVRPEQRGKNLYWFLNKMTAGKRHVLYLGPVGSLSSALLNNAVEQINAQGDAQ